MCQRCLQRYVVDSTEMPNVRMKAGMPGRIKVESRFRKEISEVGKDLRVRQQLEEFVLMDLVIDTPGCDTDQPSRFSLVALSKLKRAL